VKPEGREAGEVRVLTSFAADGRAISFFGDLHPSFAGNVVKAMASAKQGLSGDLANSGSAPPAGPSPEELVAYSRRRTARGGAG